MMLLQPLVLHQLVLLVCRSQGQLCPVLRYCLRRGWPLARGSETEGRIAWHQCDWASWNVWKIFSCDANRIVAFDAVDSAGPLYLHCCLCMLKRGGIARTAVCGGRWRVAIRAWI